MMHSVRNVPKRNPNPIGRLLPLVLLGTGLLLVIVLGAAPLLIGIG